MEFHLIEETISRGAEETREHGKRFGMGLESPRVVQLCGDLGAGKTEWVKGLVEGLGCKEGVSSPTFALLQEYEGGRLVVYHWDLYRLDGNVDWSVLDLGEQLPGEGVTVVEWAERYGEAWPEGTYRLEIEILEGDERRLRMSCSGGT